LPSSQRTSSSKQFFLNDVLGSTIALTDATGSIVRSYTYDPDGNPTTSGSGATTNLEYAAGHQTGGLIHFAARYYDPNTARWSQQDPINQITTLLAPNRYGYADSDPVNLKDPGGCSVLDCVLGCARRYCSGQRVQTCLPYITSIPRLSPLSPACSEYNTRWMSRVVRFGGGPDVIAGGGLVLKGSHIRLLGVRFVSQFLWRMTVRPLGRLYSTESATNEAVRVVVASAATVLLILYIGVIIRWILTGRGPGGSLISWEIGSPRQGHAR
jgi:RHS repeat-associated protein